MAQIAFTKAPKEWKTAEEVISEALDDTFTFDGSKEYQIEARGLTPVYLAEPAEEPEDSYLGVELTNDAKKIIRYKKGTYDLYLRGDDAYINVTVIGE